jgi:hypothetical protein
MAAPDPNLAPAFNGSVFTDERLRCRLCRRTAAGGFWHLSIAGYLLVAGQPAGALI